MIRKTERDEEGEHLYYNVCNLTVEVTWHGFLRNLYIMFV